MKRNYLILGLVILCHITYGQYKSFRPAKVWNDTEGNLINAHSAGILLHNNVYYMYGESKDMHTGVALEGVSCYSSKDLYNWKREGLALKVVKNDTLHDISSGCILERPKVLYNEKTKKFVMWFHLELRMPKNERRKTGYESARVGIAISDKPTGPFKFLTSFRPNKGKLPLNLIPQKMNMDSISKIIKPDRTALTKMGYYLMRDLSIGQASRDMTVYKDDDGKAYLIHASEDNLTLHIARLTDDYLGLTGDYICAGYGEAHEAPAIFKRKGKYYMITSGCTGWDPNEARLQVSDSIMGTWKTLSNPCVGQNADKTFFAQSTYVLKVEGKKDAYIFLADRWNPKALKLSSYIWLPIIFENDLPVLKWRDEWDLNFFK